MTTGPIGVLGLGTMGAEIAMRLLGEYGELFVYDIRPDAVAALEAIGATPCTSARALGDAASLVFASLPSPAALTDSLLGPDGLEHGVRVSTFVDLSTTGPSVAAKAASALSFHNVRYLDAPVSGGPGGARAGTLTIIASGEPDLFEELSEVLKILGTNLIHVGNEPGQGQLTKLVNNLMSACSIAITGEALALGVKGGLDPTRLLEVINVSSGRNTASADKYPRCVLPRTFDYGFRLDLMVKDVGLCLVEANRQHVPMVLGAAVEQLCSIATTASAADADCTDLARVFERWANVTIGKVGADGD